MIAAEQIRDEVHALESEQRSRTYVQEAGSMLFARGSSDPALRGMGTR